MTDVDLLLAACCETPEEDTPRLMLADAIQAEGWDGAADYIRADIELCRRPKPKGQRGRKQNALRPYRDWFQSMTGAFTIAMSTPTLLLLSEPLGWDNWNFGDFGIERGLPTNLRLNAPTFMRHAEWMFRFPVMSVTLRDRHPELDDFPLSTGHYLWSRRPYPQKFNTWEENSHHVPDVLHDHLEPVPDKTLRRYARVSLAMKDLNAAALRYGIATRTRTATVA